MHQRNPNDNRYCFFYQIFIFLVKISILDGFGSLHVLNLETHIFQHIFSMAKKILNLSKFVLFKANFYKTRLNLFRLGKLALWKMVLRKYFELNVILLGYVFGFCRHQPLCAPWIFLQKLPFDELMHSCSSCTEGIQRNFE